MLGYAVADVIIGLKPSPETIQATYQPYIPVLGLQGNQVNHVPLRHTLPCIIVYVNFRAG